MTTFPGKRARVKPISNAQKKKQLTGYLSLFMNSFVEQGTRQDDHTAVTGNGPSITHTPIPCNSVQKLLFFFFRQSTSSFYNFTTHNR